MPGHRIGNRWETGSIPRLESLVVQNTRYRIPSDGTGDQAGAPGTQDVRYKYLLG